MKRLLAVALLTVSGMATAVEYVPPAALCSTEITYTIKDASGNVMDETNYVRAWPIDCMTQVRLKYTMLGIVIDQGEKSFKVMTGSQ